MSKTELNMPEDNGKEAKGTEVYDERGNLVYSLENVNGRMVYRAGQNMLSPEELTQQKAARRAASRTLSSIEANRENYERMANEAATARAEEIMKGVDERYDLGLRKLYERNAARGYTGSRGEVDQIRDIERDRARTGATVGAESIAMRDALVNQRIGQDIGLYNLYSGISNQGRNIASQYAGQGLSGYQAALSHWGQASSNAIAKYNAAVEQDPWNKYISPTLSSGAQVAGAYFGGR